MPAKRRFTQYDALEEHGYFASNPANIGSTDKEGLSIYSGPVEFPKMLYHPTGETKQTVAPEYVETPRGIKEIGEQREIISQIVRDPVEEAELLEAGWHSHPAEALRAGGHKAPPMGAGDELKILRRQIKQLEDEKAAAAASKEQPLAAAALPQVAMPVPKPKSIPEPRPVG